VEAKAAVAHRSADQRYRRTQSVLTRRPPHPARLTGALKQKLPTSTWLKGKQSMTCEPLPEEDDVEMTGDRGRLRGAIS
jgi:hypothetical protein